MTVGLVCVTYNRPDYCFKTLRAAARHLQGVVNHTVIVNDGSNRKYAGSYKRAFKAAAPLNPHIIDSEVNRGVAAAKNMGISYLLEKTDSEWIFVLEDDILVTDPRAVTGYMECAKSHDLHHLAFALHGPANLNGPVDKDDDVSYYLHSVGAYTLYSRECLERVGLLWESMVNSMEHVEHSLRLALAGYTTGPYRWADASGASHWLAEIPGSIENSSIRPRSDWTQNIHDSMAIWKSERHDSFEVMFGPHTPLHIWAQNITAN